MVSRIFFPSTVWIVWPWKISHDSVSVGVLFEKDLIRKQHEWIACTPTHPGLADLPAVQVGGRRASTTKIGSGSHKNPWWKCVPLYKIVWPFTSGQHLGLQRLQWHLTNTMESRHHAPPLDIFNLCIGGKFSRSYIRRLNQLIHVKCHALHLRGIFMHLPSADSSHKKSLKFFPRQIDTMSFRPGKTQDATTKWIGTSWEKAFGRQMEDPNGCLGGLFWDF